LVTKLILILMEMEELTLHYLEEWYLL
jgi:hypothetical protein